MFPSYSKRHALYCNRKAGMLHKNIRLDAQQGLNEKVEVE